MSKVYIDDSVFTNIADAIRDRNGETATYKPREMDDAIKDLHNVRVKKWERPSDWPDYSKVDLTNQEVIYLTYDCTDIYDPKPISIRVYGAYSVVRGQINNGIFTASSDVTNVASGGIFREMLPTDEGDYVVYKITPQEDAVITRFAFARWDNLEASGGYYPSWIQPCVERYCRIPSWIGTANRTSEQYTWTTRYLIADTVMDGAPSGTLQNMYNDGGNILEKVDMSTCSFANVTSLQQSFINQHALSEIYLPHDLSNKCTVLYQTFYNNYSLINLDLTDWDTSGVTRFDGMFMGCRKLIEINGIENFNVSASTTFNSMFSGCWALQDLDVSKWIITSVCTNLLNMFYGCRSIRKLNVNNFDTSNVIQFSGCFYENELLTELDLTNWTVSNKATTLDGMFQYCKMLKTISRKSWDTSNVTSFDSMFRECKKLEEIDISDFDFSKTTTIRYLFMNDHSLRKIKANINIPLITNRTNVTDCVEQCWNLKDISELIFTNTTYMPDFSYNYVLQELTVPSSVINIYDATLRNMPQLRLLDFRNHTSVPTLGRYTDITNGMNNFVKIVVPDNLYDTWIAATNWSNALLKYNIIKQSDYDYYLNSSSTFINIDLSQYTWSKCSGANLSAPNGASYANTITITTGVGTMIATTAPITIPTNKTVYININEGYQYKLFYYDSNEKHIVSTNKDNFKKWFFVSDSAIGSIGLVISKIDNSNFDPADWADSGITVSYAS